MIPPRHREAINDLLLDYGALIDGDKLEQWLDFFTDDCVYKIVPRENVVQNLPGVIVLCENKNMLIDRIVSYREANEYNLHYDRHIISNIRIRDLPERDAYAAEASYAVYQTNMDGESRLFSVGEYRDKVLIRNGAAKIKEKLIIVDTYSIPTLLATPL
jgi:anthranilate 1,2-dioxygenase small subunit